MNWVTYDDLPIVTTGFGQAQNENQIVRWVEVEACDCHQGCQYPSLGDRFLVIVQP